MGSGQKDMSKVPYPFSVIFLNTRIWCKIRSFF